MSNKRARAVPFSKTYTHETKDMTGVAEDQLADEIVQAIDAGWTVELVCPAEISEDGVIRSIPEGARIRGKQRTFYKVKLYRCD